jgi:hypothetical protein
MTTAYSMDGYSDADSKPIQEEEGPPYSMVGSEESPAEESYEESPHVIWDGALC